MPATGLWITKKPHPSTRICGFVSATSPTHWWEDHPNPSATSFSALPGGARRPWPSRSPGISCKCTTLKWIIDPIPPGTGSGLAAPGAGGAGSSGRTRWLDSSGPGRPRELLPRDRRRRPAAGRVVSSSKAAGRSRRGTCMRWSPPSIAPTSTCVRPSAFSKA